MLVPGTYRHCPHDTIFIECASHLGFAGPAAWASDFRSLSAQKPSPSRGFQAETSPHITRCRTYILCLKVLNRPFFTNLTLDLACQKCLWSYTTSGTAVSARSQCRTYRPITSNRLVSIGFERTFYL